MVRSRHVHTFSTTAIPHFNCAYTVAAIAIDFVELHQTETWAKGKTQKYVTSDESILLVASVASSHSLCHPILHHASTIQCLQFNVMNMKGGRQHSITPSQTYSTRLFIFI